MATDSVLVVTYQWIIEDVAAKPEMLMSRMIRFRGKEVIRVGLKNCPSTENCKPTLMLMAINLNKMGLRVRDVIYKMHDNNKLFQMNPQENNVGSLQYFTNDLDNTIIRKCTFSFEIHVEGIVPTYSYILFDHLLMDQLWETVINDRHHHLAEVKIVTNNKTFFVHKTILAARSSVFAKQFKQPPKVNANIICIAIKDVCSTTVEDFLHFVYTGESEKMDLTNQELLKLAHQYQLTTLTNLCLAATEKVDVNRTAFSMINLHQNVEQVTTPEIRPNENMDISFDPATSTLLLHWQIITEMDTSSVPNIRIIPMKVFEYLNGDVFTAQVNGHMADNCLENPLLRLVCVNHHNVGFKIFEIFYSINCDIKKNATAKWFPMKTNDIQDLGFIRLFSAPLGNLDFNRQYQIRFCVKIASIVEKFRNKMVDKNWMTQLWSAQTDRQLTDVEIRIGSKKLEAHRVILSARSPVMDKLIREQLRSGNERVKSTINVCANVNVSIFEHFLKFLYTGSLEISADNETLLDLAVQYEVETLKKICTLAIREPDADMITSTLLGL